MLIFDGECGFCRRSLRWAYAAGGRFEAVPSADVDPQSLGLTGAELSEAVWWVAADGSRHRGHEAIARVLETSRRRPVRLLGRIIRSRPIRPLARRTYAWVAAHRGRFPTWLG